VPAEIPPKYFLKTARLGFRLWSLDDMPFARALWGNAEVTKFFGGPFPENEIRERLERELTRLETYSFQYWPIHLLANGDHVGCCGLRPYRPEEEIPELGFHLLPKYWGQGLAIEAARAVIDHGFNTIGAKSISAGHHPDNVNSKKVLAKLGFQYSHDEFFPALGMNIPYYLLQPLQNPS
jgi:ribosomal-protein-alanine N-acetyltransferase